MSHSPDATSARALWLADKLVGDYGSEAAQLLRWYASNVPVAQTGERSQQGQQAEVAPSSAPRVAEVADATSAGDSSTAGMGEPAGQTAPKEQRTPHSLPSALPDPLSKLDGMAQGCMFMADEGVRPDEWMLREWSQKLRAIHSALSEIATIEAVPVEDIFSEIQHIEENGGRVKELPGMAEEGRCRELCAMYLREFINSERARRQLVGLMRASDELADKVKELAAPSAIAAPALPELCKALGWQGGTIHQVVEQTARMRAALKEITRGAGPFNADPLTHADNCIESMKAIATGAIEGDWNPE